MQTHVWVDSGRTNKRGLKLWLCSRETCGHPIYAAELPPRTACGSKLNRDEGAAVGGCRGCGEQSDAARHEAKPIPADYPGAAD